MTWPALDSSLSDEMRRLMVGDPVQSRGLIMGKASCRYAAMVWLSMILALCVGATAVSAQGRFTDVLVSVAKDKVIAVTGVGQSDIDLGVGETVVSTKTNGPTALAVTSARLLRFSSQLRRWGEQTLETDEHVKSSKVLRELCVVSTDQHLDGFQETLEHWSRESLGGNELVQEWRAHGHLALAVTTERLVGFSAFMNGFHVTDLQGDEQVQGIEQTGDALVVKTSRRTLMFRSRMSGWTDMN